MLGMSQQLQEKWAPVLEHGDLPKIEDNYKRAVTSILLENQERVIREERQILHEALPTVNTDPTGAGVPGFSNAAAAAGPVAGFDPVLISLIRRAMPNLVAYDLAGVQPMSGPTGLIFAMRARYDGQQGAEAFFNEVNPNQSGTQGANDVSGAADALVGDNPAVLNDTFSANESTVQGYYGNGYAMSTQDSEALDSDGNAPDFRDGF